MILATDAGNRLLVTFSLVSSQRLRMILRSVHGFELDDIQPLEFKKAVESGTGCEKADNSKLACFVAKSQEGPIFSSYPQVISGPPPTPGGAFSSDSCNRCWQSIACDFFLGFISTSSDDPSKCAWL